ncbi:hypothetical protein GW17_00045241 [Ensete ventricosum]|nr:hypothetical protein GW17_00045241 [Ensete ventricosum]RZS00749.1 hypothetical protein BHM03_00030517 [Ensete ventricosum]
MIEATAKLDCFSAYILLREPDKSEDKVEWPKGSRKQRRIQRGLTIQKLSVGQRGVPQCRRGRSTDYEERDIDARQRIVVSRAWQRHGVADAGLSWSHYSLASMEGER